MRVTSMFKNDVPRFIVFMVPGREPLKKLPDKFQKPVVFLSFSLSFYPVQWISINDGHMRHYLIIR